MSVRVYYFRENVQYGTHRIEYLLSYAFQHAGVEIHACLVNAVSELPQQGTGWLLYNLTSGEDLVKFHRLVRDLRRHGNRDLRLVVGGMQLGYLEPEDFLEAYPEVSHLIIGNGERAVQLLVEERLPPGIHDGRKLGRIAPYRFDLDRFPRREVLLTLGRRSCRWNRCSFCHHPDDPYQRVSPDHVADDIVAYLAKGANAFGICDSELDLGDFAEVFGRVHQQVGNTPVAVGILGVRILPADQAAAQVARVENLLKAWPSLTLTRISLGLEFYHQEVLDWYRKGITIADIDATLQLLCRRLPRATTVTVSLLFGLPRVRDHHIRSILEFERRHFLALTLRGGEKALLACFFRLSPFIGVHRRQEEFGVVPGEPYHVNDLQGVDGLPEIRTRYLRFLSWDEDQRGYLTRAQVLAKHQVGLYRCIRSDIIFKWHVLQETGGATHCSSGRR